MNKAHLIFTNKVNSYNVYVKNLEELSVEQIQQLQAFVSSRNGTFDFNSYNFKIRKRLEFNEFVQLINASNIEARCQENIIVEKTQPRISFGQYKGLFYSDLSDSYMLWLKTNYRGYDKKLVDAELKKRNL